MGGEYLYMGTLKNENVVSKPVNNTKKHLKFATIFTALSVMGAGASATCSLDSTRIVETYKSENQAYIEKVEKEKESIYALYKDGLMDAKEMEKNFEYIESNAYAVDMLYKTGSFQDVYRLNENRRNAYTLAGVGAMTTLSAVASLCMAISSQKEEKMAEMQIEKE